MLRRYFADYKHYDYDYNDYGYDDDYDCGKNC